MEKEKDECHITSAEWQIMKVVWANNEVTSKFVSDVLCYEMGWKKSTIKTLLNRLLEKGALKKREKGNRYIYYTEYTSEATSKREAMEIFNKICRTKVGKLIGEILSESLLSFDDLDMIQDIINEKRKTSVKEVPCECLPGQCNCHQHHKSREEMSECCKKETG